MHWLSSPKVICHKLIDREISAQLLAEDNKVADGEFRAGSNAANEARDKPGSVLRELDCPGQWPRRGRSL